LLNTRFELVEGVAYCSASRPNAAGITAAPSGTAVRSSARPVWLGFHRYQTALRSAEDGREGL
jgi:hypothetical protein